VSKAKEPEKGVKAAGSEGKKTAEITCFVCGAIGHYARDCEKRKGVEKALVATATVDDGKDEEQDEWDLALITNVHNVFFSKYDVLLDNEASINIFSNRNLLTGVRDAEKKVMVGGIQRGASGVKVTEEGEFRDVGTVYVNDSATANILSFASQVNAGADITYDKENDRFVMQPAGSKTAYYFGRKQISGSEGKFYICDTRSMIECRLFEIRADALTCTECMKRISCACGKDALPGEEVKTGVPHSCGVPGHQSHPVYRARLGEAHPVAEVHQGYQGARNVVLPRPRGGSNPRPSHKSDGALTSRPRRRWRMSREMGV
jgi:Zinc knuckle